MNRSVDFQQGFLHAAEMFQGSLIDPSGALVIVENIELGAKAQPPQYAQGMLEAARRVREELKR